MASPPVQPEILAVAYSNKDGYVPAGAIRRPSTFLSLAPTTSASYPLTPLQKSSSPKSSTQASADHPQESDNAPVNPAPASTVAVTPALPSDAAGSLDIIDRQLLKARRSSSLGSDGSNGAAQQKRFLRLGPVHFGEGNGKGDWSEDVVSE